MLAEIRMLNYKLANTPMVQNHRLGEQSNQITMNKERYQYLIKRLLYLSHTLPDIAYVVSLVSQFMHNPSEDHINSMLQILRYLKSSLEKRTHF
jgi:hypothetical protein